MLSSLFHRSSRKLVAILSDADKRRIFIERSAIGIVALAAIVFLGYLWGENIPAIEGYIAGLGVWGPLIFIVLFIILMIFFVPNASFAFIAGALFGLWKGTIIIFIAGLIAEMVIFTGGRRLFRKRFEERLLGYPKLMAFQKAVITKPIKLMILLRLSPLPFTPICYMLSVTNVSYRNYIIGYLGFLPGNFVTVYFGFVAKHMAKAAAHVDDLSPPKLAIAVLGLIATIVLVAYISKAAKKAIDEVNV